MAQPPDLTEVELVIRLGMAAAMGAVIGAEREWRDRTAGLRTHMLVCLGSAAFTIVSAYGFQDWHEYASHTGNALRVQSDPARIAAQIVSGIGFLGAGAIFRSDDGVRGLTTAASLWMMAAIGMAAGAGYYALAVAATAMILIVLVVLREFGNRIRRVNRGDVMPLEVVVTGPTAIGDVFDAINHANGTVSNFLARATAPGRASRRLTFDLALPAETPVADVVGHLALLEGVDSVAAPDVPTRSTEL